ncbi:MAG: DUF2934 domain-containing protein [Nitrospira sp.]|nr:DUF2934 domain-containing protein [Nitrospira sp.]
MMDTNVSRTTPQRVGTAHTSPSHEKTAQARQAVKRTAAIALRAYELYEKRGRQDGQALEDWLNAERQLAAAAGC